MKKYTFKLTLLCMMIVVMLGGTILLTKDKVYAANIDAAFPTSYKNQLDKLAKSHPSWSFVAVNTGLDWNDVITGEISNKRCLIEKSRADILLSKASGHYKASGTSFSYVAIDGKTWVNASRPVVAYYMDPRNFFNEQYIFQFEALGYNEKYHTVEGVEAILAGTDLENKIISYTTTTGIVETLDIKYSDAIFAAGKKYSVSPLYLASKIRQETGASLSNNSISGIFSYNGVSYKGYYNFYNIGANATATGSAVANGLNYAKNAGWDTPVKAIESGAEFLVNDYIKRGQNTAYFQKFNVVKSPYYNHQYEQNLTAPVTKGNTTYTAYDEINIIDKGHVFYIPIYKNMPKQTSTVKITKTVKTGTMIGDTNMRKGPSTSYEKVITIPKGSTVTLDGAIHMESTASVVNRLAYPYWYKVSYKTGGKTYTGYAIANNITADEDSKVKVGKTLQLKVTKASSEKVYYETSNPAIATVDSNGIVSGVNAGTCQIFAITSTGTVMDSIGITVYSGLIAPKLSNTSNTVEGIKIVWSKVDDAQYYRVYRKEKGGSFSRIYETSDGKTISYIDKTAESNKEYYYTVRAGQGSSLSSYDTTGIKGIFLGAPLLDKISATASIITFSWNEVTDATGYYLYRKTEGGSWLKINDFKVSDFKVSGLKDNKLVEGKYEINTVETTVDNKKIKQFSYTDKSNDNLPNTTYYYTVRAYNNNTTSWYNSDGLKVTTLPEKTDITNIANISEGVKITWGKVNTLDSYAIYRKTASTSYSRIATINDASTVTYTDKTAKSGTTYIYTIRVIKDNLYSEYNKKGISIMHLSMPKFTGVAVKTNAVKLNWNKITGAKGYYLYRKNSAGKWARIATINSGSKVEYIDEGRAAGTKYIYTVKAFNSSYVSSYLSGGVAVTTSKVYQTYKTTTKVNYRNGAGTTYTVMGTIAKGTKVSVEKGYSKVANGYTWYRIKLNGKEYYVVSKYLKKI